MTQALLNVSVTYTSSSDSLLLTGEASGRTATAPVIKTVTIDGQQLSTVELAGGTSLADFLAEQGEETVALMREARVELAGQLAQSQPRNVRTLRMGKGWSQQELAAKVGMSQPQIARLESYRGDPCLSSIQRVAAVLGVKAEDIVASWPISAAATELA